MNREQRRKFNQQHKTKYSKEEFDMYELYREIRAGNLNVKDLADNPLARFVHIDNEELVPEGTPVKLAYEAIKSRPQFELTEKFKEWIEQHKDDIFHVTREEASSSLVCLAEDVGFVKENYKDDSKDIGHSPWLFSIYSDLLYQDDNGEWVDLGDYESRQEARKNKK